MRRSNDQKPSGEELNVILERAKAEWEAAFDSVSEGLAIVETNGRVKRVNRALASLLGRDVRSMVGLTCCDLFAHHRAYPEACPVQHFPEGKQGTFEVFFPEYRYYEDSVHPIMRAGRVQGFVITVRDVTREQLATREKRHVYLQMEEAHRRRKLAEGALDSTRAELDRTGKTATVGNLATIVFAEVNRAVHTIHDGLEEVGKRVARAGKRCQETTADVLDSLRSNARRTTAILEKLASLRVDDAEAISDIFMHRLVAEVAREVAPEARAAGVTLECDSTEVPPLAGNRDQLKAVLTSLVLNAVDATRIQGGAVNLTLRRERDNIRLDVQDTGSGIDSEALPQIFNPFFTTATPGTRIGLGLTICLAIIQGHHGHIEVKSQKDSGTKVTVHLPLNPEAGDRRPEG